VFKKILLPGAFLALAAIASPLQAAPASLHWSTYLRSGPGPAYPVLDELEHDTVLEVGGCNGGWCKVSSGGSTGYVDRDSLQLPEPPLGAAPQPGSPCVRARVTSYPRPALREFCQDAAATAPTKP
jgi:hypothetical protein